MNYNLLEEKWIPVLRHSGEVGHVGIKDALTEAGTIRGIAASSPMDRLAVLRFLLALLYWCKGNPPADPHPNPDDSFPIDWFTRLDDNRGCFNLLGEGKRFYQYRRDGDKTLSANYLIHEIPTGSNIRHFRHSTDKIDGLCPACCATGLLRLPLFSTSGGRGKPPGINSKPPVYVVPAGESLAATLRLSWREVPNLGTPAWERPDLQLPQGEVPFLTGLTWLPRRVWLEDPSEPEAPCLSCGHVERLIRLSVFAAVGSSRTDEGDLERSWRDPHVVYLEKGDSVTSLHAKNPLAAVDAAAGQWSEIMAGVLRGVVEHDAPSRSGTHPAPRKNESGTWVVGFSTVQNDKYVEAIEFLFPSPDTGNQIEASVERLGRWQKEVFSLARRLARVFEEGKPIGSRKRKHVEIPSALGAVRPDVEAAALENSHTLLPPGVDAWEQAAIECRRMMRALSRSLSPGFTTTAVQRRRRIGGTVPDIRRKTEGDKGPGHDGGGHK